MIFRRTLFQPIEGEKIILIVRHHWFVIFRRIIFYVLLASLPPAGYFILQLFPELYFSMTMGTGQVIFTLALSVYYLYILIFFFHDWLDYYLDFWIITNHRIVDIEQRGVFSRTVSQHQLSRIQDISADVRGIIPTFMEFGSVQIQTAAAETKFIMEEVPQPYKLVRLINNLANECRNRHP